MCKSLRYPLLLLLELTDWVVSLRLKITEYKYSEAPRKQMSIDQKHFIERKQKDMHGFIPQLRTSRDWQISSIIDDIGLEIMILDPRIWFELKRLKFCHVLLLGFKS